MRGRLTFLSYRLLARFAEILPASAIVPISRLAGSTGARLMKGRRRLVTRNLARVLRHQPPPHLVTGAFVSYCRYWLDALRLPVVPRDRLDAMLHVEGLEHITDAREHGKGVVLALPHMGNWDVAGAWLVARGIPLTVVVESVEPHDLFVWFRDFRASLGFDVVVTGPKVASQLSAALRRNEAVALLCDRDVDGTGGDFELFSETTQLPKGPAMLAMRTGAALLPVAVYEDGSKYRAVISEPIATRREGRLGDDVDRVTKELTHSLETLISKAPEQWHLFRPNWPSDR